MAIIQSRRPSQQTNPQAISLFFMLPPKEQRARILKLARSRLNAATIASICGMQAAEVERVLGAVRS